MKEYRMQGWRQGRSMQDHAVARLGRYFFYLEEADQKKTYCPLSFTILSFYHLSSFARLHRIAFKPHQSATFKSIKSLAPLFDRVLVQRFKPETKTASGIFLPSSAQQNPLPEATVIAVGPGAANKVSNGERRTGRGRAGRGEWRVVPVGSCW